MHRRISGVCTSVRRRPRRARVEGKRSRVEGGAVVGREPAGRRGKERSGELERREPSNLVPSRLEVCKNKREERSACHVPRRPAAPPPPPIADPSRLVAVARKNYPLSRLAAILSGVEGGHAPEISRFFSPIRLSRLRIAIPILSLVDNEKFLEDPRFFFFFFISKKFVEGFS